MCFIEVLNFKILGVNLQIMECETWKKWPLTFCIDPYFEKARARWTCFKIMSLFWPYNTFKKSRETKLDIRLIFIKIFLSNLF